MEIKSIFTIEDKEIIGSMFIDKQKRSGLSGTKFARTGGFTVSDFSNLNGEKWKENASLIGESKWIRLARFVNFTKNNMIQWKIARTSIYVFIHTQLDICKNYSSGGLLCDEAGIGKSVACREYAEQNPHVFYVDCSKASKKNKLIKTIAQAVGCETAGRYDDILDDTVYALKLMQKPLIIFDEAGDLANDAILFIKSLYNQLENLCGFYLVGADGLKKKLDSGIGCKTPGYTEVFSRFGADYSKIIPKDNDERYEIMKEMAEEVLTTNGIDSKSQKEITANIGRKDLRAVYRACIKLQAQQNA